VSIKRGFGKPMITVLPLGGTDVEMLDAEKIRKRWLSDERRSRVVI